MRTYTCDECGGTYDSGRPDEDAKAESQALFGADPETDPTMAVVCDDCFRAIYREVFGQEFREEDHQP